MRQLAYLSVLLAAGWVSSCATSTSSQPPANASSRDLFNGRNLDGWQAFLKDPKLGKHDVWRVEDGLLICKGEPMGYLYTEQNYTHFRLLVDWRWAPGKPPGNSGVLLRVNGPHRPLPRCIEAQLKSGDAGDLYGFHGMKIDGPLARRRAIAAHELAGDLIGVAKLEGNEKEPGQWNTYEIVAQGPTVTVWVNGKKLNEAFDCDLVAGPIALQSEGGEIHFRSVQITPLAPTPPSR